MVLYSLCVMPLSQSLHTVKQLLLPASVVLLGSWLIYQGLQAEKKLDKDLEDLRLLLHLVQLCSK